MAIDPSASIAPTARIHPDSVIGPRTRVGEFAVIEQDVSIGADCLLEPHVYIKRWTTLGDGNQISAGTVLGTDPLDKGFTGERSYLVIGNRNRIREHYTISRGTKPESSTTIGDGNYIMTAGHIAHNCIIGNDTVIASGALVAGYAEIGDGAFLSGNLAVHQYGKVGRLAMISGLTRVNLDAPPFFTYYGYEIEPTGVNVVGLRRAGFNAEQIRQLKTAYKLLYRADLPLEDALGKIETELPGEHSTQLVQFIRGSKRGICRPRLFKAQLKTQPSEPSEPPRLS